MEIHCNQYYAFYFHKEIINVASLDLTVSGKKIPFLLINVIKIEERNV